MITNANYLTKLFCFCNVLSHLGYAFLLLVVKLEQEVQTKEVQVLLNL
jgi:hypothetical protein